MICPLYKAALIANMGKFYTNRLFIDGTTIDDTEITGCDKDKCSLWNSATSDCGLIFDCVK